MQSGYKILIVEDSMLNQEALRRILTDTVDDEQTPHIIITAMSGPEALEKIAEHKPDLILLDIILPGMSGFDILVRLKEMDIAKMTPVIIISGLTKEEDEEKGLYLGAVDYIAKPFKKSIIAARIKTQLKIVEQMRIIERLSLIDPLTNIPNRRNFDNYISLEWRRAIRDKSATGLLMIDVDRFKNFNDKYGHQQGDVALQTVAFSISSTLKRATDFAARWGGEEFVVLLPNTDTVGARNIAEQIRMKIEGAAIHSIGNIPQLNVTVSIGAASMHPAVDSLIADLIENADKALYTAKENGRNRVCSYQAQKGQYKE